MPNPTTTTTATGNDIDPRTRYRALQDELTSLGATVTLRDLDALPNDTITDLTNNLAHRLRALREGQRSGWTPPQEHT